MRYVNARSVVSVVILTGLTATTCLSLMVSSSRSQTSDPIRLTPPPIRTDMPPVPVAATGSPAGDPDATADERPTFFDELPQIPLGNVIPAAQQPPEDDDALGLRELVSEILMIRRRQGTLLKGTLLERPPQGPNAGDSADAEPPQEFEQLLRQMAKSQPASEPLLPLPPAGHVHQASVGFPIPPGTSGDANAADPPASHTPLLAAGRALDARAAMLEQQGEFDQAERVRRLARRIRIEARQWAEATPLR
jgi:hypothetical protein